MLSTKGPRQKVGTFGSALFFVAVSLWLNACTTRQHNVAQLEKAQKLRGKSLEEVRRALGNPSDQDRTDRAYWFLTEDNSYHPEPRVKLYEFIFVGDRLVEIKESK